MVIFEANKPMLTDPDKIYPGQVLRIPVLSQVRSCPASREVLVIRVLRQGWPAAIVIQNDGVAEMEVVLRLSCLTGPSDLPMTAFLDDGDSVQEIASKGLRLQKVGGSRSQPRKGSISTRYPDDDSSSSTIR